MSSRGLPGRLRQLPQHWQTTAAEIETAESCDHLASTGGSVMTRAIDIPAPASATFRWLCQLSVAPYSYDWIDNAGRRSPRTLTPGTDLLCLGQNFLIGTLTAFEPGHHITVRAYPAAERLFGLVAMTYRVTASSGRTSRLVARLIVHQPGNPWEHLRYHALAWGDLIMMRKQLMTLRELARRTTEPERQPVRGVLGDDPPIEPAASQDSRENAAGDVEIGRAAPSQGRRGHPAASHRRRPA